MKLIPTGNDKTPAVFSYGDLVDRHDLAWLSTGNSVSIKSGLSVSGSSVSVKNETHLQEHYDMIHCCSTSQLASMPYQLFLLHRLRF